MTASVFGKKTTLKPQQIDPVIGLLCVYVLHRLVISWTMGDRWLPVAPMKENQLFSEMLFISIWICKRVNLLILKIKLRAHSAKLNIYFCLIWGGSASSGKVSRAGFGEKHCCHINPDSIMCQSCCSHFDGSLGLNRALIRRVNSAIFQFGRALFRSGRPWHRW